MAKIIENKTGRRTIRLNTDDILTVVREYQNYTKQCSNYNEIRNKLKTIDMYLPEDMSI